MESSKIDLHSFSSTFSGGVRSCIGWRFAYVDRLLCSTLPGEADDRPLDSVLEIQAFLVTLVRKFDFSHADHYPQIRRAKSVLTIPIVLGEEYKGTQLPLKISAIRNA